MLARACVWLKSIVQVTRGCPVAADASARLKQAILQQELEKCGAREVEVRLDQEGEGDSKGRGFYDVGAREVRVRPDQRGGGKQSTRGLEGNLQGGGG